jgi:hypothetical protein
MARQEDRMVRLAEWPRNPYLNDELHEWVRLHLDALGVEDVAVYATASGREDDERRILVVTEVGLLDGWYAPRGSTARYSLSVRLYPWQAVHGVDLRGETFRLWAHEHQSRWRLRLARPALDTVADTPDLGRALTQFAAACSVMAEPAGASEVPMDRPEPDARPTAPLPARPVAVAQPRAAAPISAPPAREEADVAAFTEPEAVPAPPDGTPPEAPQSGDGQPYEEVVATIGEVGPSEPGPPAGIEPPPSREGDAEEERWPDLARRLGLR